MGNKKFVQFGNERIPIQIIAKYELKSNLETKEQREARKKLDVENGILGGALKGGMLGAVPGVAVAAIFSPAACLAIVAGGAAVGGIKGNKKAKDKFEKDIMNHTYDHSILIITLSNGKKYFFHAENCSFNIYDKCKELDCIFGVNVNKV